MLTKFTMRVSFFAGFITLVYCVVSGVSILESLVRGLIVLLGFYLVLIAFFLFLRVVFDPRQVLEERIRPDNKDKPEADTEAEESITPATTGVDVE